MLRSGWVYTNGDIKPIRVEGPIRMFSCHRNRDIYIFFLRALWDVLTNMSGSSVNELVSLWSQKATSIIDIIAPRCSLLHYIQLLHYIHFLGELVVVIARTTVDKD